MHLKLADSVTCDAADAAAGAECECGRTSRAGKQEMSKVALSSVAAALFLVGLELAVALWTNSLGVLSTALHSALDLLAAGITFYAVRMACRPPDADHPYGHGKVENFSALVETLLLLATCLWIFFEAASRIFGEESHVDPSPIAFAVMGVSIAIDLSRSRALMKAARKYNSQALEADAIHFSTDMLSAVVVIAGLFFVWIGAPIGDPLAAIGVAIIILWVSLRLGRKTLNSLVDRRLPEADVEQIKRIIEMHYPGIVGFHRLRTRSSGPDRQVDVHILFPGEMAIEEAHRLSSRIERDIKERFENTQVLIHMEPCGDVCGKCPKAEDGGGCLTGEEE